MLRAEKKYIDKVATSLTTIGNNSASGSLAFCPIPGQGNSVNTRVGDQIRVTACEINVNLVFDAALASTIAGDACRLRLIVGTANTPDYNNDFVTSNAACTASIESAIFDNASTPFATSLYKPSTEVSIKRDRYFGVNPDGGTGGRTAHIKMKVPMNQVIKFTPGSTTAGKGSVFLYMVSDDNSATAVAWQGQLRFHFVDA